MMLLLASNFEGEEERSGQLFRSVPVSTVILAISDFLGNQAAMNKLRFHICSQMQFCPRMQNRRPDATTAQS